MKGGIWGRALEACKALYKDEDVWFRAFGLMLEAWCRDVANHAASTSSFQGKLLISAGIGDSDEVEDVVLVDGENVALFSVKGRVMPETARGDDSRLKITKWYESVLFEKKTTGKRGGAIRLLDMKVREIREREHASIPHAARVYPVVVTFDDLGDTTALHQWVERRRAEEQLLDDANVARTAFIDVAMFERLMAVAAIGGDLFAVLRECDASKDGTVPLDSVVTRLFDPDRNVRLPHLVEKFAVMTARIKNAILGGSVTDPKAT